MIIQITSRISIFLTSKLQKVPQNALHKEELAQ